MSTFFMISQPTRLHSRNVCLSILLLLSLSTMAFSLEPDVEEEIEILDVIEITGSAVLQTPHTLTFPEPEIRFHHDLGQTNYLARPTLHLDRVIPTPLKVLRDQTAKSQKLYTPVKPRQTERPPFPRRAREQGWHGRVILRLRVLSDGTVESSSVQKSSGYELLDSHALKTAALWTFEPAKNGGFPVSTTVNIPIQFDLIQ